MANNIKGITIEIDGNTTKLSKALSSVNRDIKSTNTALKDVNKLLELDPSNTTLLEQKQRLLAEAVGKTKDKLELLKDAQEQAAEALTNGDIGQDEYDALTREVISCENELSNYESQADAASGALDLSDSDAQMEEASKDADQLADKTENVGEQAQGTGSLWDQAWSAMGGLMPTLDIASVVSGIITVVEDLGKKVIELEEAWDESMGTIAETTGLTGEALDEMTSKSDDMWRSLKNGSDVSSSDASAALGEVMTRFGVTGDAATDLTEKILTYADVTGQDGVGATDSLADAMKQWGDDTENIYSLMDDLTYASQQSGASVSDLSSALADGAYQFKELGYSQSDALELLSQVAWAGGDTSTVISGMETAIKNLNGEVDDVPGTFQLAMDAMSNWDGESDILNESLGDTGLTISDVFGEKKAQKMVQAISAASDATSGFAYNQEDANGKMEQTAEDSVTLEDNWARLTRNYSKGNDSMKGSLTDLVEEMADASEESDIAGEHLGDVGTSIAKNLIPKLKSAQAAYQEVASESGTTSASAINDAAQVAAKLAATKWDLPKIKLPHFTASGEFSVYPLKVPTFSVSWYAKAMQNAMVLNSPTIFGAAGNSLLAGGEAGNEVVSGEAHLMDLISKASGGDINEAIYSELHSMNVNLYRTLVGALSTTEISERDMKRIVQKYA